MLTNKATKIFVDPESSGLLAKQAFVVDAGGVAWSHVVLEFLYLAIVALLCFLSLLVGMRAVDLFDGSAVIAALQSKTRHFSLDNYW